jgi:hypothetical protein
MNFIFILNRNNFLFYDTNKILNENEGYFLNFHDYKCNILRKESSKDKKERYIAQKYINKIINYKVK